MSRNRHGSRPFWRSSQFSSWLLLSLAAYLPGCHGPRGSPSIPLRGNYFNIKLEIARLIMDCLGIHLTRTKKNQGTGKAMRQCLRKRLIFAERFLLQPKAQDEERVHLPVEFTVEARHPAGRSSPS